MGKVKTGYLYTEKAEASVAVEVLERGGWSFDLAGTATRAGVGIAKDIFTGPFEVDIGAYLTTPLTELTPRLGMGLHARF